MARVRLGVNCKLYRNTGTHSTPTWTEIDIVKEVEITADMQEYDITTRAEGGATATEPTLLNIEINGMIRKDDEHVGFLAMDNAFWQREALEYLIHDGATNSENSRGIRTFAKIFEWSEGQKNGDVVEKKFKLKPTISPTAGETMIRRANVEGGTVTYVGIAAANTTPS
jgi:hypothetical protein